MSNAKRLFNRRNQTCDFLVSNILLYQIIYALTLENRQDLNSSVMTGSKRVFDHTTFTELRWRRDPFTPSAFTLPPGFQKTSHLLTEEFVELLKDIRALQCIRDFAHFTDKDMSMIQIDNHQASIQSRLVSLPKTSCSFLDCCHLAAYLCSAMLRCRIWRDSVVPVSEPHGLHFYHP